MTEVVFVVACGLFVVTAVINWQVRTRLKALNEELTQLNQDLEDQITLMEDQITLMEDQWNTRNMTK